jgi:type II secretory pathway pseudopilin PulG
VARRSERGITLIEATIVLTAVAILAGAAAPVASRSLDRARVTRAIGDAEAIKTAIINFRANVFQGFTEDGTNSGDIIEMLVGDGDVPVDASITDDNGALAGTLMRWNDLIDDADTTDNDPNGITVDTLENHLVVNTPIFSALNAYPLSGGNTWRGTYIDAPINADPWGNRYAVNVMFLLNPSDTKNDTFVLSTGPDEQIDTLFEQNGATPGDDDILVMVLRDRNSSVP